MGDIQVESKLKHDDDGDHELRSKITELLIYFGQLEKRRLELTTELKNLNKEKNRILLEINNLEAHLTSG